MGAATPSMQNVRITCLPDYQSMVWCRSQPLSHSLLAQSEILVDMHCNCQMSTDALACDTQTMYPLTSRLEAVAVAPELRSQPPFGALPSVQLLGSGASDAGGGRRRLHLKLDTVAPCWGAMNMTGPIAGWSFAPGLPSSAISQVSPCEGSAGPLMTCADVLGGVLVACMVS